MAILAWRCEKSLTRMRQKKWSVITFISFHGHKESKLAHAYQFLGFSSGVSRLATAP